jgi:hypothetical protein
MAVRRTFGATGTTSATSAAAAASVPATAKQAEGGGTSDVPTTASASSARLRKGKEEPKAHATWRADNAVRTLAVNRAVSRTL